MLHLGCNDVTEQGDKNPKFYDRTELSQQDFDNIEALREAMEPFVHGIIIGGGFSEPDQLSSWPSFPRMGKYAKMFCRHLVNRTDKPMLQPWETYNEMQMSTDGIHFSGEWTNRDHGSKLMRVGVMMQHFFHSGNQITCRFYYRDQLLRSVPITIQDDKGTDLAGQNATPLQLGCLLYTSDADDE